MPRFLCLRHLEQYYRENIRSYDMFCWYVKKGVLKQVPESECEHCKVGVPLLEFGLGSIVQKPEKLESAR
jgi:hypothetical protein